MAESADDISDFECPICKEYFCIPKILPCTHVLCRHCLVSWLWSDREGHCPLCREVISDVSERDESMCDAIANSFITDLAMEARVECQAIINNANMCAACLTTKAVSICLHCDETLCLACASVHTKASNKSGHKMEDLSSMTAEKLASLRRLRCEKHSEQTSVFYCSAHREATCPRCAAAAHHACPEVRDVEEQVKEARSLLGEMAATLKAGEMMLEEAMEELDRYLRDAEKAAREILDYIDEKFNLLRKNMEDCRRRLTKQAWKQYFDAKVKVETRKSTLLKRRGKVTSHWRLINRVEEDMPRACAVSDMIPRLQNNVSNIDLDLTFPDELNDIAQMTLTIDEKQLQRIQDLFSQLGFAKWKRTGTPENANIQQAPVWRFDNNHGQDIVLSERRLTAEKVRGAGFGIVIGNTAMNNNVLHEVRIEETDNNTPGIYLACGVTDRHPASLTLPRGTEHERWEHAVLIGSCFVWSYGTTSQAQRNAGASLYRLCAGSRVGLLVDDENRLRLYVDEQDKGIVASGIRRPCYALFELFSECRKIRALLPRCVS